MNPWIGYALLEYGTRAIPGPGSNARIGDDFNRKERKLNVLCHLRPHLSIHLPGDNTIRHNSSFLRSL
jgi:hypothetical protein